MKRAAGICLLIFIGLVYSHVCPELQNPKNGHVHLDTLKPGGQASYTCDTGYRLRGHNRRRCQTDFTWTFNSPFCKARNDSTKLPTQTTTTPPKKPSSNMKTPWATKSMTTKPLIKSATTKPSKTISTTMKPSTTTSATKIPSKTKSATTKPSKTISTTKKPSTTTSATKIPSKTKSTTTKPSATKSATKTPSKIILTTTKPSTQTSTTTKPSATKPITMTSSTTTSATNIPSTTTSATNIPSTTTSATNIPSTTTSATNIPSTTTSATEIHSTTTSTTTKPSTATPTTMTPSTTTAATTKPSTTKSATTTTSMGKNKILKTKTKTRPPSLNRLYIHVPPKKNKNGMSKKVFTTAVKIIVTALTRMSNTNTSFTETKNGIYPLVQPKKNKNGVLNKLFAAAFKNTTTASTGMSNSTKPSTTMSAANTTSTSTETKDEIYPLVQPNRNKTGMSNKEFTTAFENTTTASTTQFNATKSLTTVSATNTTSTETKDGLYPLVQPNRNKTVLSNVTVCAENSVYLACEKGQVIYVESAMFGRNNPHTCPSKLMKTEHNCTARYSDFIVKWKCNRRSRCFLESNTTEFGDPCIGTYKYLEVSYMCIDRKM